VVVERFVGCVIFVVVMFVSARDVQLLFFLNDMAVLQPLISKNKNHHDTCYCCRANAYITSANLVHRQASKIVKKCRMI
jgi:hypothetical protein